MADDHRHLAKYYRWRADPSVVGRYSPFDAGHLFTAQRLERELLAALRRHDLYHLASRRILDVGCGDGAHLRRLIAYGAEPGRIAGVDVLPDRIATARTIDPCLDVRCADGDDLPFADFEFDIVFQMMMFSLILDAGKLSRVATEMDRVLRPGGVVISYDFRVARDRRVTRPITYRDLVTLFPDFGFDVRRVTLAPPLARALAGRCWIACEALEAIPMLRTHELVVLRKPADRRSSR